jgi:hypothetical protein
MSLTSFRFEASFPAHPDFLEPLAELAHAMVLYAGCPSATADLVASEVRTSIAPSLAQAAGGGPVVVDCSKSEGQLTIEVAAPHHAGLRIVQAVPAGQGPAA